MKYLMGANRILKFLKAESALCTAGALLVNVVLGLCHAPAELVAAVDGVMAAVLGVAVRSAVTPVGTARKAVHKAAKKAAAKTAENLDKAGAGAAGVLTEMGETVADLAAVDAAGGVLKDLGLGGKHVEMESD